MHAGSSDPPFGGIGGISGIGMRNCRGIEVLTPFVMRAQRRGSVPPRQGFANPAKRFGLPPPYGEKAEQILQRQIRE